MHLSNMHFSKRQNASRRPFLSQVRKNIGLASKALAMSDHLKDLSPAANSLVPQGTGARAFFDPSCNFASS
jgi:hypothetical protein